MRERNFILIYHLPNILHLIVQPLKLVYKKLFPFMFLLNVISWLNHRFNLTQLITLKVL